MDAPLHDGPPLPNGTTAVDPAAEISPEPEIPLTIDGPNSTATFAKRKKIKKKKKQVLVSDIASSASSNNCYCETSAPQKGFKIYRNPKRIRVGSLPTARRSIGPSDVNALGHPLGMSIAVIIVQVLERQNVAGEKMSVDHLSRICILAVREYLGTVFGDKFDNFVTNFEKSFRSTLKTLRSISDSSQNVGEQPKRAKFRESSCSKVIERLSLDKLKDSVGPSEATTDGLESILHRDNTHLFPDRIAESACPPDDINIDGLVNLMNRQLVLRDKNTDQQLASISSSNSAGKHSSMMLSTMEKSVMEQTRANDLKTFEIGLNMKRLQLKERQLEISSNANFLERWKLSMGFSKASFKVEKFKTQLQETREVELLKRCLDFLVAGLFIMLFSLAYGTYVYSHRRIIEATEACSPLTESKSSWWMPKSMSTFNSGLQLLKCQIQVLSRMLFAAILIITIAFLIVQRSATSHQTMPITFILLLLGIGCGYAGKFCIDTLGGSGNHWLLYWEVLCSLHFFSNMFHTFLFSILYGPIAVAERVVCSSVFPYWIRRMLYFNALLFLPLLCGFMPFATPWEWIDHFSSRASDFAEFVDD